MDTKARLAVSGILLIFGGLVFGLGFAPALAARSFDPAENAPNFLQPSAQPPTPTDTRAPLPEERITMTPTFAMWPTATLTERFAGNITTVTPTATLLEVTATPTEEKPFLPENTFTDTATATVTMTVTQTVTQLTAAPGYPPNTPTEPNRFLPDVFFPTPVPPIDIIPTNTEPATSTPIPTDTPPTEPVPPAGYPAPEQAPDATCLPEVKPAVTVIFVVVTQTAVLPTVVSGENIEEEGVIYLPFTEFQLQIIGIISFAIMDFVLLRILFRNWNKPRKPVR